MVPPAPGQPERLIAPEIADRYSRALNTVQKQWTQRPDWPDPVGKRGRWKEYDARQVADYVEKHFARDITHAADPDALLTVNDIAALADVTARTIRSDMSRRRLILGDPDDTTGGVKRWRADKVEQALQSRTIRYSR